MLQTDELRKFRAGDRHIESLQATVKHGEIPSPLGTAYLQVEVWSGLMMAVYDDFQMQWNGPVNRQIGYCLRDKFQHGGCK